MESSKLIIYQVFTRLYGNRYQTRKPFGTIEENGCGKMNDFSPSVLKHIREQGFTHVWYTGIIRHATTTDYSRYGIPRQHPAVVKGRAGSPYAITDYYDVDPDLAVDVPHRMEEFAKLVNRTHRAGMKMIIDFVPNHVARQYQSIAKPAGIRDLGEDDNPDHGFDLQNNFYYCPVPCQGYRQRLFPQCTRTERLVRDGEAELWRRLLCRPDTILLPPSTIHHPPSTVHLAEDARHPALLG